MSQWTHIPILAAEIADLLLTDPDGVYADGTLGLGGHTALFLGRLSPKARILGFDKDAQALQMAKERVNDPRLITFNESYVCLPQELEKLQIPGVKGALFDLGLSSYQLDNPARGFSIINNGPLDMRFDLASPLTAQVIVNTWGLDDLTRILTNYGEERKASQIALAILNARRSAPIQTTEDLKQIVERVYGFRGKTHPATQTFQALRIAVNDELGSVEALLASLPQIIARGGRAAVLTFHSLEDRLVKNRFKELAAQGEWKLVNKKVIVPSYREICQNRRARSAKLRVIERL
ncbi:16S rRNA (cytosine(1402)-N(4))-methyltransferase RsmH [Candidatus Avelusimicrobium aviculae]|uniref:16S rRNA (cytosine(1402)-N(4))-methyltransferase RsmH n=1 Tax=Candidatus Avelusimicrobium aviculae TaxID=3416206 RepID=UPI003D132539